MRLLYITNDIGAFHLHRRSLANHLAANSHEITVIGGMNETKAVHDAFDARINVLTVQVNRHRLSPWSDLQLLITIAKEIKSFRPDIVHSFTVKPIIIGAFACRIALAPESAFAMTFSGLGKIFEPSRNPLHVLRKAFYAFAVRRLTKPLKHFAIVENPLDKERLSDAGIVKRENCHVHPGAGVDATLFFPGDPKASRKPCVLMAARLIRGKGIFQFAEAAKLLAERGIDCRFIVAGPIPKDDPDRIPDRFFETTGNQLEYVGNLGEPELARLLREEVDIACLPTLLSEGFPRTLIEAAASGCALLGSDQEAIRQVIVENRNGFLLQHVSAAEIAQAIQKMIESPVTLQRFRQASIEQFHTLQASTSSISELTLKQYRALLDG